MSVYAKYYSYMPFPHPYETSLYGVQKFAETNLQCILILTSNPSRVPIYAFNTLHVTRAVGIYFGDVNAINMTHNTFGDFVAKLMIRMPFVTVSPLDDKKVRFWLVLDDQVILHEY